MHTPPHIPNYPTAQYKHTQSTPGGQQGKVIVCTSAFCIRAPMCQTEIILESEGHLRESWRSTFFLFAGYSSSVWVENLIPEAALKLHKVSIQRWKVNFILKGSSNTNPHVQSLFPSYYPEAVAGNREMTLVSGGDKTPFYPQGSWKPMQDILSRPSSNGTHTHTQSMTHTQYPNTNAYICMVAIHILNIFKIHLCWNLCC